MMDGELKVLCAVTTAAMDDLDGTTATKPDQRQDQFLRLRDQIEERAAQKFLDVAREGKPPGVILRSIDFQGSRAVRPSQEARRAGCRANSILA